jgi:hypothetical protein
MNPIVAGILNRNKDRRMPLVRGPESKAQIVGSAQELFPESRAPEAAHSGLMLFLGRWTEAHEIAQNVNSAEGNYWHAIIHRQEPDAFNSSYWFRQVGAHPIFSALRDDVIRITGRHLSLGPEWDPFAFIEMCEEARTQPDSQIERTAIEIQHAEWVRLFEYCSGGWDN